MTDVLNVPLDKSISSKQQKNSPSCESNEMQRETRREKAAPPLQKESIDNDAFHGVPYNQISLFSHL